MYSDILVCTQAYGAGNCDNSQTGGFRAAGTHAQGPRQRASGQSIRRNVQATISRLVQKFATIVSLKGADNVSGDRFYQYGFYHDLPDVTDRFIRFFPVTIT